MKEGGGMKEDRRIGSNISIRIMIKPRVGCEPWLELMVQNHRHFLSFVSGLFTKVWIPRELVSTLILFYLLQ